MKKNGKHESTGSGNRMGWCPLDIIYEKYMQ